MGEGPLSQRQVLRNTTPKLSCNFRWRQPKENRRTIHRYSYDPSRCKKKLPLAELSDEEKIPAFLDGVATDVIEGDLNLVKLGDVLKSQQF